MKGFRDLYGQPRWTGGEGKPSGIIFARGGGDYSLSRDKV
jgi:hypothetical protein